MSICSIRTDLLVLHDDELFLSRDNGHSWLNCSQDLGIGGIASVVAPHGIDSGALLLVGFLDGSVTSINMV